MGVANHRSFPGGINKFKFYKEFKTAYCHLGKKTSQDYPKDHSSFGLRLWDGVFKFHVIHNPSAVLQVPQNLGPNSKMT